jgi:preprotein translocase subunit SecF
MAGLEIRRNLTKRIGVIALLLGIYPAAVMIFTCGHVLKADFEGGRNGQLDAYRHALASATVSHTLGEWAVDLTTWIFESRGRESNLMDIHNNRIGAEIGAKAKSFGDIEPAVRQSVLYGRVSAVDPNQITWLPRAKWKDGKFW